MKKIIISILIALLIIGAIITTILVINNNDETQTTGLTTIQLNEVTRSVFYAPQYVAINKGFFKEIQVVVFCIFLCLNVVVFLLSRCGLGL